MTEAESAQVARLFQDAWKLLARLEELQRRLPELRRCRVPIPRGLTKGDAADLLTATFARARR
jgi:hypothetical protein